MYLQYSPIQYLKCCLLDSTPYEHNADKYLAHSLCSVSVCNLKHFPFNLQVGRHDESEQRYSTATVYMKRFSELARIMLESEFNYFLFKLTEASESLQIKHNVSLVLHFGFPYDILKNF